MNRTLPRPTYTNEYDGTLVASLSIPAWIREYTNLSSLNCQIVSDNAEGAVTYTVHSAPPGFNIGEDGVVSGTCGKFHTGFIDVTAEDSSGKTTRITKKIKCWPYALQELTSQWAGAIDDPLWKLSLGIILIDPNGPVRKRDTTGEGGEHRTQPLAEVGDSVGALMTCTDFPPNLATMSSVNVTYFGYSGYFYLREDANGKRYIDFTNSKGRMESKSNDTYRDRGYRWTVIALFKDLSSSNSHPYPTRIISTVGLNSDGNSIDDNCAGYYGGCVSSGDGWSGGTMMMSQDWVGTRKLQVCSAGGGSFTEIGPGGTVIGTTFSGGHVFNGYYGSISPSTSYYTVGTGIEMVTMSCNSAVGIGTYHKVALTNTWADFSSFSMNTAGYTGSKIYSDGVAGRTYKLGQGIGNGGEASAAKYTGITLGDGKDINNVNYPLALYGLIAVPMNANPLDSAEVKGLSGFDQEKFEITQYFMQQMVSATPDFTINWPSIT